MVTTFLPFDSFSESLSCLDNQRLGKQRVESFQLIQALLATESGQKKGYQNHPAAKMWHGYINALIYYYNLSLDEWEGRGFNNNMQRYEYQPEPTPIEGQFNDDGTQVTEMVVPDVAEDGTPDISYPWWFGWEHFHMSHRASLLRKHPMYYRDKFPVSEFYQSRGYLWPSASEPKHMKLTDPTEIDKLFAPINKDTMRGAADSARRMYTVDSLKQMCRERGIKGYSGKKKDELFALLGIDIVS